MRNALIIIGNFLLTLLGTQAVKELIVKKLKEQAAKTDNEIDDAVVRLIDSALKNEKNVDAVKDLYKKWTGNDVDGEGK